MTDNDRPKMHATDDYVTIRKSHYNIMTLTIS